MLKNGLSMDTSAYFQPLTVKLLCDLNSFVKSVAENGRTFEEALTRFR